MPVSALLLCFLFCFQPCTYARLSHVVREERVRHGGWSWPKFPVWTPRDLGLQHITLTGVLHVGDKPTIVTLLTFLKASLAANNTVVGLCLLVVNIQHCQPYTTAPIHTDMAWTCYCV